MIAGPAVRLFPTRPPLLGSSDGGLRFLIPDSHLRAEAGSSGQAPTPGFGFTRHGYLSEVEVRSYYIHGTRLPSEQSIAYIAFYTPPHFVRCMILISSPHCHQASCVMVPPGYWMND